MKRENDDKNEEAWDFGDVWKQEESEESADLEIDFVEILRGDTGAGFDDSYMLELVTYLGSLGIRATYDSFSAGLEMGAIKTYVLKVESGKEDEAIRHLKEKR
jgi:hypothetical protein